MGSIGIQEFQTTSDLLDTRFSVLKQSLVQPGNKQKVIESYGRLLRILESEVGRIQKHGSALVPEIDFAEVQKNGGNLPEELKSLVHDRGCIILRNVVPAAQATAWETSLKAYVADHPTVGGHPHHKPAAWNVFWTKAQMEMRTHPSILAAMRCVSQLWHVSDDSLPIDLDSQAIYPDRIRIRYPSLDPGQFPLAPHLDSGAIERWEDEEYRKNYASIFKGEWQDWDAWCADYRIDAKSDLYQSGTSCSAWRSLQGWLSLSHTNSGEGTLRLLPSLKASVAYVMLQPLFHTGEWNDTLPTFPGSSPGSTQFFPTAEHHPALQIEKAMISIPNVRPGDYVFWHCDLIHGVDPTNPGEVDSSVSYNACVPLTPYNIENMVNTRESFERGDVPVDFARVHGDWEREFMHEDCGAKVKNILSEEGLQAMGLKRLSQDEEGITPGQRAVRMLANDRLGL